MKKSQHLGELDPNRIIGPVEDLNIFRVLGQRMHEHIPKSWLLLKRKIKTSARPKKQVNPAGGNSSQAMTRLKPQMTERCEHSHIRAHRPQGTVVKMKYRQFGWLFLTAKRSRVKRTRTLRKSLVTSSATQDERAQMDRCLQKVTSLFSKSNAQNIVQNKSPYEFLQMLTNMCDKERYEVSWHSGSKLEGQPFHSTEHWDLWL